jgi:outer membrane protein OmpA-like peptidoglycan-associated protein
MLRKTLLFLCLVGLMSAPAMAIEPPDGASIPWGSNNTAYTAWEFNDVLEAYGLSLAPESVKTTPASYAKMTGDKVMFGKTAIAYRPAIYHSIFTSYGLELSPEEVTAKLGYVPYASVKDGTIVFASQQYAYNAAELKTILSAYNLPMVAAPAPVVPMTPAVTAPGDSDGDGVTDDKDACPGTPKGIMVDERGCWSHPSNLLFDFDKAVVRDEYKPALRDAKKVFDAYPTMTVQIVGHTCDMGPESYNQNLSERRAKAVRDFLVNEVGIDSNRLSTSGFGETKPAYPNDSEVNRQKNRRVEFMPKM